MQDAQLQWIVDKIDKDEDNMVDPEELKALVSAAKIVFSKMMMLFNNYGSTQIRQAFVDNDADGTGTISSTELPNVLRSLDHEMEDDNVR